MRKLRRLTLTLGNALLLAPLWAQQALADLPTAVDPKKVAAGAGDYLELAKGYIGDAGVILGLAITVLGFTWVSYTGFSKFNDARNGKAEWSEVGLLGVVGTGLLMLAAYLLTEADAVIT